jgi:lipopolysaccharide export system permease protein
MKKLDKLILKAFIGPFVLTFLVVIFILLSRQMLYYFDDIIGKDIGFRVLGQFVFYFILVIVPVALPLAVLLSSLITFGNLAEHFELTAIKSTGVSPLRVLRPVFLFTAFLTGIAFWSNNYLAPQAALEAYTLLYDIKQKKPTLDIQEGTFYNGLPDVSIKVDQKFSHDPAALKAIILYDHREKEGEDVFVADSGRMYTILNDRYMKFELYRGYNYKEGLDKNEKSMVITPDEDGLSRSAFNKLEIVYDLASFELSKTSKALFEGNRLMRNLSQLETDIDTLKRKITQQKGRGASIVTDSYKGPDVRRHPIPLHYENLSNKNASREMLQAATNRAREGKRSLENNRIIVEELRRDLVGFEWQWYKIITNSLACVAMFLVGAPLGAIIKRGGLGIPFLISIAFFIIYTLLGMQGEKLAARGIVPVPAAAWAANIVLLLIGVIFLKTAQTDGRLFESDTYSRFAYRLKTHILRIVKG